MKYCSKCGSELVDGATFCSSCGAPINGSVNNQYSNPNMNNNIVTTQQPKSKIAAGLLGIFLGSFGVHNFYLGYTGKAVGQLLLTLVGWILCGIGPIAAAIWGLVEGILILTGSINRDANGNMLAD